MPARTYMVVDRAHDHSFRIPRPDLTLKAGTPNACNDCHKDKSAQWAEEAVTKWHGPQHKGFQTFGGVPAGAQRRSASARPADRRAKPFRSRHRARHGADRTVGLPLRRHRRRHAGPPERPRPRGQDRRRAKFYAQPPATRLQDLAPLLEDPVLGVRLEVGRALAGVALDQVAPEQRARLENLFAECESVLGLEQDRPEGRANLAIFLMGRNRLAEAEAELVAPA